MAGKLVDFDLEPFVDWPDDIGFSRLRAVQNAGLVREQCPSEKRWHFQVLGEHEMVESFLRASGFEFILGMWDEELVDRAT